MPTQKPARPELVEGLPFPSAPSEMLPWLPTHTFAHRGLHGEGLHGEGLAGVSIPENSSAAFAAAIQHGYGIECDVQLTADNRAMVFHDFTLDRLTAQSGALITHTADNLSQIPLTGTTDHIPTLEQFLNQISGQTPILIEIKSEKNWPVAILCAATAAALQNYTGPHAIMSFDPRAPAWFAKHSPNTPRGLVITEEDSKGVLGNLQRHLWVRKAQAQFLAYDIRDLPSRFAAKMRKNGLPIATWTVRTAAQRATAALHADAPIAESAGLESAGLESPFPLRGGVGGGFSQN